jgi:hypothetical protein
MGELGAGLMRDMAHLGGKRAGYRAGQTLRWGLVVWGLATVAAPAFIGRGTTPRSAVLGGCPRSGLQQSYVMYPSRSTMKCVRPGPPAVIVTSASPAIRVTTRLATIWLPAYQLMFDVGGTGVSSPRAHTVR